MVKLSLLASLFLTCLVMPIHAKILLFNEPVAKAAHLRPLKNNALMSKACTISKIDYPHEKDDGYCLSNYITENYANNHLSLNPGLYFSPGMPLVSIADTMPDRKVVISNGTEGIEISPYSTQTNGALVQPINRAGNKGISTSFYLPDTSSWTFYTNATHRLIIQGDGKIVTKSPLLINSAGSDTGSALRVNGIARFDTSISIRGVSDNSFITLDRNVKAFGAPDDGISPYSVTPTSWANGGNIPGLRIRHPLNVTYIPNSNPSIYRDFLIMPYQYGTAITFNGVVECWVGEWSIHRGNYYYDVEGKGNGWGSVLWVGDDHDMGGVRATARNNIPDGNNVAYGELSVEKFVGTPNGDFRLRLPSKLNEFHFVYGERGSNNIVAKISDKGFFISQVSSIASIQAPEKAQILFDSTDSKFKGYNGTQWITLADDGIKTGSSIFSASGITVYTIVHGLNTIPSYYNVIATSPDAANISYITADAINISVHYASPPVAGTNNLSFNWQIKK